MKFKASLDTFNSDTKPEKCGRSWYCYLYEPVWRLNVHLLWPAEWADVMAFVKKAWSEDQQTHTISEEGNGPFVGCAFDAGLHFGQRPGGEFILALHEWVPDPAHFAVLSHECAHIARKALDSRGVSENEPHESFCYLLEHLVCRCGLLLNQRKAR